MISRDALLEVTVRASRIARKGPKTLWPCADSACCEADCPGSPIPGAAGAPVLQASSRSLSFYTESSTCHLLALIRPLGHLLGSATAAPLPPVQERDIQHTFCNRSVAIATASCRLEKDPEIQKLEKNGQQTINIQEKHRQRKLLLCWTFTHSRLGVLGGGGSSSKAGRMIKIHNLIHESSFVLNNRPNLAQHNPNRVCVS